MIKKWGQGGLGESFVLIVLCLLWSSFCFGFVFEVVDGFFLGCVS